MVVQSYGCEMLKNFAMMGMAVAPRDRACDRQDHIERVIEQTNCSAIHINQPKSKSMPCCQGDESCLNVCHTRIRWGRNRDDLRLTFFDPDCVHRADNVDARLYEISAAFLQEANAGKWYSKTKGSTQVVVPSVTENYGAKRDPPEKSFAICTLPFPSPHRAHPAWARDNYEETFKQTADDVNGYLDNPNFFANLQNQQNMKLETLNRIKIALSSRPTSYGDCVVGTEKVPRTLY